MTIRTGKSACLYYSNRSDAIVFHVCRSHDGFEVDENGVFTPVSPKYADQRRVFNDLGQGVLDNAFQGVVLNVSEILKC